MVLFSTILYNLYAFMQSVRFYKRSDNHDSLSIYNTDNTARVPPGTFDPFSNPI